MGTLVTLWLVRFALVAYLASLARMLSGRTDGVTRGLWAAGFVMLALHVVAAFGVVHDWSHTQAWEHTAAETEATVGFAVGAGVYFNYLFVLLWGGDVAWWWLDAESYRARPRWVMYTIHIYLAFIVFNGVVVFESGLLRWLGVLATIGLSIAWWKHRRENRR